MRAYTEDDREVALAALEVCRGDVERAAKFCKIPLAVMRRWAAGETATGKAAKPTLPTNLRRPYPPEITIDETVGTPVFVPAPELAEWVMSTFIASDAKLRNPHHEQLQQANIGFLWTNVGNRRQMRDIAGTAEIPMVQGSKWIKARAEYQLLQWFGEVPDFLITLYAPYAVQASDAAFCALNEHELLHCAQAENIWGGPRFKRDGSPLYALKGHDCEEFVSVVERYGPGHAAGRTLELVEAARRTPTVAAADISAVCGTCLRMAA